MWELDVKNYTSGELKEIRDCIDAEINKRKEAAKNGMWNTVVQSIINYTKEYGNISVYARRTENSMSEFSSAWNDGPGKISL